MHKLDRNSVTAPHCLADYDYKTHSWDDDPPRTKISGIDKQQVRERLMGMQGNFCAYCESVLYDGAHVEHFRRKNKNHFPELTFAWSNLFLSCESHDHCGHYKDRRGASYNPNDLIKPDEIDPDQFFYFHSSGEVRLRPDLQEGSQAHHKAKETIRVFNLDEPALVANRRNIWNSYKKRNPSIIDQLIDSDEDFRAEYIQEEIEKFRNSEFSTTIRHFLEQAQ